MKPDSLFKILPTALVLLCTVSTASAHERTDRRVEHQLRLKGETARPVSVSAGRPVTSPISAFSDYRISTAQTPARFSQDRPSVRQLKDSNWIVMWHDNREGSCKIFGQLFRTDGSLIGSNFEAAASLVGHDLVDPKLVVDNAGRVFLLWRDRTSGELWLRRYTPLLVADLGPILINDTTGDSFAGLFDCFGYPDGRLVVAWESYQNGENTVVYKTFDAATNAVVGPSVVHANLSSTDRWSPAVAVDPAGGFAVTWEDYRNGNADIFLRQFSGAGAPIGTDVAIVPNPASSADQFSPAIQFSTNDKYVVGWLDSRLGQEVYAQRFDPINGLIGSNVLISAGDSLVENWDVVITANSPNVIIGWAAYAAQNQIRIRPINGGLNPLPVRVANLQATGQRWAPSLWGGFVDRYSVCWVDVSDDPNIHSRVFNNSGSPLFDSEILANDDNLGAPNRQPAAAIVSSWWNLIAFKSNKRDDGDIYLQSISHDGLLSGGNMLVNQDAAGDVQSLPAIASDNNQATIVWIDSRVVGAIPGQRIFGRTADPLATFVTPEFQISETSQGAAKQGVAIASTAGHSLVVWLDQRSGVPQVWGRWLVGSTVTGAEFQLSTGGVDIETSNLHAISDLNGKIYVAWLDRLTTPPTIRGKWYTSSRTLGGSFSWTSSVVGVAIEEMSIGVHQISGLLSIFWTGFSTGKANGYLLGLSSSGSVIVPPLQVNDDPDADPTDPSVAVDEDGYTTVAWADHRLGKQITYSRQYDAAFSPIGANQTVASLFPDYMTDARVTARDGRAWFVWADPRTEGDNIYAAMSFYSPTDIDDPVDGLPSSFALEQNYPNPFNPTTTISFQLPQSSEVTLTVSNLLGQSIRTLVAERLAAGEHTIVWDGRSDSGDPVGSGIYFYRLAADGIAQSRKMLLVK